jgi:hypothetical protein
MDPATLEIQLRFSHLVVNRNLQDVSHEESLRAPQPAGNCANWVLGHLVASRQHMLGLLGRPPLWDRERIRRYDRGSPAVTDPEGADAFGDMLADFNDCQERLLAGLAAATPELMAAEAPWNPFENPEETVGSLLAALLFHECYHAGQTGLLRRLLGKPAGVR